MQFTEAFIFILKALPLQIEWPDQNAVVAKSEQLCAVFNSVKLLSTFGAKIYHNLAWYSLRFRQLGRQIIELIQSGIRLTIRRHLIFAIPLIHFTITSSQRCIGNKKAAGKDIEPDSGLSSFQNAEKDETAIDWEHAVNYI